MEGVAGTDFRGLGNKPLKGLLIDYRKTVPASLSLPLSLPLRSVDVKPASTRNPEDCRTILRGVLPSVYRQRRQRDILAGPRTRFPGVNS